MFDSLPPQKRMDQLCAAAHNGELISINDFSHDDDDLHCIYCQCKMIRVRGEERAWHYRHNYKSLRESHIECTYDLYLQSFAEKKIVEWYTRINSLKVSYPYNNVCSKFRDCKWNSISEMGCSRCEYEILDVKKDFPRIKSSGIVRTSSLSSHRIYQLFSDENQTKSVNLIISAFERESQIQMPEGWTIVVQIECEQDIEQLIDGTEIKESRMVSFYNFSLLDRLNVNHVGDVQLRQIKLFKSGKLFYGPEVLCTDTTKGTKADIVINYRPSPIIRSAKYWLMAIASREPYCQHYCLMCKHHYYQDGHYYCKQTSEELDVNFSASCDELYEADESRISKKIEEFQKYNNVSDPSIEIMCEKYQ